jgi:hypothetical protein
MFCLALWTFIVLLLIPVARFRAGRRREVVVDDFRYGESARVPPAVSLPNRNYMNLLEMPILFYAISIVAYVAEIRSPAMLVLAWSYVALRVLHSLIHLTYNKVFHRLAVFAASNTVLAVLWILGAVRVL